uniref:VRK serine/threonine kinase 1 n=1 Tax=Fundulus heteroclitus TaxID=8078 RepID=A0A3Q2QTF8_FUNHE
MPPKAKAAGKGRAPAKRKLAEEFPPGEVLTDTGKKSWKLGPPVGKGGFGLIYLAEPNSEKPVGPDARYVIKVEPSENGPLFCELNFYTRAAKPDLIQKWLKAQNLKQLGVPKYWGSGQHDKAGKRYRFMVIDRLGTDLQKKFEECGKRFPRKLVLQLGLRLLLLDIGPHVHAVLQVYLVDYGLAYRYAPDGVLKEYKEDPKKCHNGTIEFTSIDAHKGASPCRRSDLQILSYCMVQWLCGRLPWEDRLQDPVYVRDSKISQENISEFLSQCFSTQDKPAEIQVFVEEVMSLGYNDKPPYERLRSILQNGLKSIQAKDDSKLEFTPVNGEPTLPAKVSTHTPTHHETFRYQLIIIIILSVCIFKPVPWTAARPRKLLSAGKQGDHKSRMMETATQTSPGLGLRSRGRKKVSS